MPVTLNKLDKFMLAALVARAHLQRHKRSALFWMVMCLATLVNFSIDAWQRNFVFAALWAAATVVNVFLWDRQIRQRKKCMAHLLAQLEEMKADELKVFTGGEFSSVHLKAPMENVRKFIS